MGHLISKLNMIFKSENTPYGERKSIKLNNFFLNRAIMPEFEFILNERSYIL